MHVDAFKIYIDRLRGGTTHAVEETVSSEFVGVEDDLLRFSKPIRIKGQAYIAEEDLILHFGIEFSADMPCAICNEWTDVKVKIENLYEGISLEEIRGAVYDITDWLREEIILKIPHVAECRGNCPNREEIKSFIKDAEEDGYRPFADLHKLS